MMIIKRLNSAVGAPYTAVIADQEITELLANEETYRGDAKAVLDFVLNVLPSGTADALAELLIGAVRTEHILLTPAPTDEKGA